MKKDTIKDLGDGSQIRVAIAWIYSKVKLLKDIQKELYDQIEDDGRFLEDATHDLESMKTPFGGNFIVNRLKREAVEAGNEEIAEQLAEIGKEEEAVNEKVEEFLQQRGFKDIKWMRLTMIATVIHLLITMMVTFYKYDFLNCTACTVALLLLTDLEKTKPKFFRLLVVALVMSLLYDIFWFWNKYRAYSDEDDEDGGGMERALKRFSWVMASISFLWKIIMSGVYWKASIDLVRCEGEERQQLLHQTNELMDIKVV